SRRARDDRAGRGAQLPQGMPGRQDVCREPGRDPASSGNVRRKPGGCRDGDWAKTSTPRARAVNGRTNSMRMTALKLSTALAVVAGALGMSAVDAGAEALRDNWCSDVKIRFFVGGAEGDGFGVIVYNGAVQAA